MWQEQVGRYESDLTVTSGNHRYGFADWDPGSGQGTTTYCFAGPLGVHKAPFSAWFSLTLVVGALLAALILCSVGLRRAFRKAPA